MKTKITIKMHDSDYAEALGKYLSNNAGELDIIISTEQDKSDESEEAMIETDLLLTDIRHYKMIDVARIKTKWIGILTEDRQHLEDVASDSITEFIFMYDPASIILREIRFIISNVPGSSRILNRDIQTMLAGFCGGGSGTGKTAVCIAVARDISKRYMKKVLYLNYECFPSSKAYFKTIVGNRRTMTQYLYYIFKHPTGKESVSVDGFICQDEYKVSYFNYEEGLNQLKTLNITELGKVISCLCSIDAFDYIFVDFSSEWSEESQFILELCQKRFVICDNNPANQIKNTGFVNYFKNRVESKTRSSFDTVINKEVDLYGYDAQELVIEYDGDSFYETEDITQISLGGSFGNGIRSIADYMLHTMHSRGDEDGERTQHA